MTLRIGPVAYLAESIPAGVFGTQAVRLTKPDGTVYDLIRTHDDLLRCDCADYEFRHRDRDTICKHGHAVVAAGMVQPPCPVPNPQTWRRQLPAREVESRVDPGSIRRSIDFTWHPA